MSRGLPRSRLLVADDEPHVLAAFVGMLGDYFDLVTATNAEDALQRLADQPVDIALTDYQMSPGNTGVWLLEQIQDRYPTIRRILCSGAAVPELQLHLQTGLIERFFPKPVVAENLIQHLTANQGNGHGQA